jgi:glutamine synthetase
MIPSCFFSWDKSYALDEKIPLLRSEVALQRESMHLFKVLGETRHTRVHMDAGLEQEFFLIDRKYFLERPDLMVTGRTVLGAMPPKGQELEDQVRGVEKATGEARIRVALSLLVHAMCVC